MRNVRVELAAAALLVCFGASLALACGIQFAWQLLDNRAATLDTMPVDTRSFAYAEVHLVPAPKDNLITDEAAYSSPDNDALAQDIAKAETKGLTSDEAAAVRQMRAESTGDGAFDKGLTAASRGSSLYRGGGRFSQKRFGQGDHTISRDPRPSCRRAPRPRGLGRIYARPYLWQ